MCPASSARWEPSSATTASTSPAWSLGRSEKGGNAISFTHVDEAVSKKAIDELLALPQIVSAELVKL